MVEWVIDTTQFLICKCMQYLYYFYLRKSLADQYIDHDAQFASATCPKLGNEGIPHTTQLHSC